MKPIDLNLTGSGVLQNVLRLEYRRTDFGAMERGRHAVGAQEASSFLLVEREAVVEESASGPRPRRPRAPKSAS